MGEVNKHGLRRYIDADTKRLIRQNSKFGCIVPQCRNAFYEYEHILPEFHDATVHDPDKICLVCSNHNPRKRIGSTYQNYDKQQLQKYYDLIRNNENPPVPRNHDFFSGFDQDPEIIMGACSFQSFSSLINIDGENVFSFARNMDKEKYPFAPDITFSGKFMDPRGNLLFQIDENEWSSPTTHWDVETKDGEICIWDNHKQKVFHALKAPGLNRIEILCLKMWLNPFFIEIGRNDFVVSRFFQDAKIWKGFSLKAAYMAGKCAVHLNSKDFPYSNHAGKFSMQGAETTLEGTGITLGKGASSMHLRCLMM